MKISQCICLMVCLSWPISAFSQDLDTATAEDMVARVSIAKENGDFDLISELCHPKSLEYFRRIVSISLDKLEDAYSVDEVEKVTGVNRDDLASLSDSEFFVRLCQVVADEEGNIGSTEGAFPVLILGIVRDGSLFHALFRLDRSLSSDSDAVAFHTPLMMTFAWLDSEWRLYNVPYGNEMPRAVYAKLAKQRKQ